jgi:16S rRNA (cytidine1402-2'-O)-methyltransferase
MGKLVLVPTPLGNLEDITLRSLNVLKNCALVLAEDTRTTGKLFHLLGLSAPLQSYHMHNEHKVLEKTVERIAQTAGTVALVTDAGTPGISDPGFLLVRACIGAGIEVETLPGPTAFVPALVSSGLPSDRFVFEGFLPLKKGRQTRLTELAQEKRTLVLYESPHKIAKTLAEMAGIFGPERPACVAREISKMHETYHRGTLAELAAHFVAQPAKGEIVLVVGGAI